MEEKFKLEIIAQSELDNNTGSILQMKVLEAMGKVVDLIRKPFYQWDFQLSDKNKMTASTDGDFDEKEIEKMIDSISHIPSVLMVNKIK